MTLEYQSLTRTRKLVVDAICIALVLACTMLVNIRLPLSINGGLIHLGNVPLFLAAILFGKRTGAICGALGMAMFDLISGWTLWAPFTFVIVGLMGYLLGLVAEKKASIARCALGIVLACLIKIAGYYAAEGLLYANWIAPLTSIPGNLVQVGVAGAIVLPLALPLKAVVRRIVRI